MPIQISESCWKYTDKVGNVYYKKTFHEESDLHRQDGPAIEFTNGYKAWYINGKRHREDGPAIELASGGKSWWINNRYHRKDGPAVEWANGDKEWYYNGKRIYVESQEQFDKYIKLHFFMKE